MQCLRKRYPVLERGRPQKRWPARGLVVGDFNGDGYLDLAVANHSGRTLSILLGNGDGTFAPLDTLPMLSVPRAFAARSSTAMTSWTRRPIPWAARLLFCVRTSTGMASWILRGLPTQVYR